MKRVALIALMSIALVSTARAELTIDDYERSKDESQTVAYVIGIGTAYSWANISLLHDMQRPLYCPPLHLAINGGNYLALMNEAVSAAKARKVPPDVTIALLLLEQLKFTFPCR